jgi:hypothetical protein
MRRVDRERLLAHDLRARLERGLALLPVVAGWAPDHDDVRLLGDDVMPVRRGLGEAPARLDLGQQVRIPPVDDDELDLVPVLGEVGQMRTKRPRPGPDDAEAELRHRSRLLSRRPVRGLGSD